MTRKMAKVSYRAVAGALLMGSAPKVVVVADPEIMAGPLGPRGVVVPLVTVEPGCL